MTKPLKTFFNTAQNQLIAFLLFLAVWGLVSIFFDDYILPSPVAVLRDADTLLNSAFLPHLTTSLIRILMGFGCSYALGTAMGVIGYTLRINLALETVLMLFQVLPGLILGIIFLLLFGMGSAVPIALIITLSSPMIALNTANTLMKRNPVLENMIRSFNGTLKHLVRDLYFPSLIPVLKTNATMGLVMAVKIVILGEFIACENGIGYLLNVAKIYFDMTSVCFYLLVILALITCFQLVINVLFTVLFQKFLNPD